MAKPAVRSDRGSVSAFVVCLASTFIVVAGLSGLLVGSIYLRDVEAATGYASKYEAAAERLLHAVNQHAWGGAPRVMLAPGVGD